MSKANRAVVRHRIMVFALILAFFVICVSSAWQAMGPDPIRMRKDVAKVQIGILEQALEKYAFDVGSYPPSLDGLRVAPADLPPGKWKGPYLNNEVPSDPWGNPYRYVPQSQHGLDYDIWTISPGGDVFSNWGGLRVENRPAGSGAYP